MKTRMQNCDAAEYLGLNQNFAMEDLRRAYHRLARELHPDAGGNADQFLSLQRAYEILKNSEMRERLGDIKLFERRARAETGLDQRVSQVIENLRRLGKLERRFN